jgi:hypothetical protein
MFWNTCCKFISSHKSSPHLPNILWITDAILSEQLNTLIKHTWICDPPAFDSRSTLIM